MSNILSIKDENGNWVGIDAIQGERGPAGPMGPKQQTKVVLLSSSVGWSQLSNGKFKKILPLSGITSTDSPVLDVELSSSDDNLATQQITEWSKIERAYTGDGQIEFRSIAKPEIDLNIIVKGF